MLRSPEPPRRIAILLGVILIGAALVAGIGSRPARAQVTAGYGAGVFEVDGSSQTTITLADGGTYYLIVAPDNGSTFVRARIYYNVTTLEADVNETGPAAAFVSLAAGNYSLSLLGHGRAALGWDFTDGALQDFPDNATATGFLRPASPRLNITVALGDAQEIHLEVYDDRLLPAAETNVTTSGTVSVNLPAGHATYAFLLADVVTGAPQGVFGLAWSSPSPPTPGPDVGGQVLSVVLWIGVPVILALLAFVLLTRRRRLP